MELIEVGQLVNTHGIKGEMKLNPWTDDLYDLLDLDIFYLQNGDALHVESSRVHKNCLIVKFREIADRNEAERRKGITLFTEKVPLPEGRYYIADLLGMQVSENGVPLGVISDVFSTGSNDVYEVKSEKGNAILIPVIDGVVQSVDVESKRMEVILPAGLLD